jgi:hypothetical protein
MISAWRSAASASGVAAVGEEQIPLSSSMRKTARCLAIGCLFLPNHGLLVRITT